MPRNELGELRRSSLASPFGPGAIVDFVQTVVRFPL